MDLLEIEGSPGSVKTVAWSAATQAVFASAWNDIRVFDASDRDNLVLRGREPIERDLTHDNRSLAIAAIGDVILSSNWDQFGTYRYYPSRGAGDLWISADLVTQQNVASGEPVSRAVFLENHGTLPLTLSIGGVSAQLEVAALPTELVVGDMLELVVTYTPLSDAAFSGTVELLSDDPDQSSQTITFEFNQPGLGVGSSIPDMSFDQLQSGSFSLSELSGKPILLAYFATF